MKISKQQLRKIIKEEKAKLLNENAGVDTVRFEEIMVEINDLVYEAVEIARSAEGMTGTRAERYWFGHIKSAVGMTDEYPAGSATTMQDTLSDLSEGGDEDMMELGYNDGADGKAPAHPDNEFYMTNYKDGASQ